MFFPVFLLAYLQVFSLYKGSSYCFCRQAVVKYEIEYPYYELYNQE